MKSISMENKFKPIKLETTENKPIVFDTQGDV